MDEKPDKKRLKEYEESFYKLNRLMGKINSNRHNSDLELQYEYALFEVGRLKGVESGLDTVVQIMRNS